MTTKRTVAYGDCNTIKIIDEQEEHVFIKLSENRFIYYRNSATEAMNENDFSIINEEQVKKYMNDLNTIFIIN
jgi:hypothetical protein